jgi:gamma-glutamyltranspeptidase/glutathione hydrolase
VHAFCARRCGEAQSERRPVLSNENSQRAVVAAGHEAVVDAARTVLGAGGNAFDATVAGGFAAAVVEPGYTSLGGGGFLLARTSAGEETLFDFFVDTPGTGEAAAAPQKAPHLEELEVRFAASTQKFMVGRGSVAVPGCLAGYLRVHERLGRLPLSEVVAPAVELGRRGVVVNEAQAYVLRVLAPVLTLEAEGASIFAPDGRILGVGDRLGNEPLAAFLSELPSRGRSALYDGARAAEVAADIREGGGLLVVVYVPRPPRVGQSCARARRRSFGAGVRARRVFRFSRTRLRGGSARRSGGLDHARGRNAQKPGDLLSGRSGE